jgi:hypothetical protein
VILSLSRFHIIGLCHIDASAAESFHHTCIRELIAVPHLAY